MIDRPYAVVSVDEEVLGNQVVLLQDRGTAGSVLNAVWVSISMAGVCQVRLPVPCEEEQ